MSGTLEYLDIKGLVMLICKGVKYDTINGQEFGCEYKLSVNGTCGNCLCNGGKFDPRTGQYTSNLLDILSMLLFGNQFETIEDLHQERLLDFVEHYGNDLYYYELQKIESLFKEEI